MKRFDSFLGDSNKVGKAAAISTIIGLFVLWNVSGVLWGFWRTLDNLTSNWVTSPTESAYGYWYGDLGWGYGYWYWYGSNYWYGYYYDTPSTWSTSFNNPKIVTAGNISSVSTISGTIWSASSVTITATSQLQIASWVQVTLPAWVVITDTAGWNFDFSNFTWATNGSVSDLDNKTWTPVDFWVTGEWLTFSKPVKVEINVGTNNAVYPRVKHNGGTWWVDGLTLDSNATCSVWVPSSPISLTTTVTPVANIITIYTCRASTFAASTWTSSGWSSGGGWSSTVTVCKDSQLECKTVAWVSKYYRKSWISCTWGNLWKVCTVTSTGSGDEDSDIIVPIVEETEDWKTIVTIPSGGSVTISDISNSFAKTYIEKMLSAWLVNWYDDGTFRPENNASRAEYLKMVLRAMGEDYSSVDTTSCKFNDVDKSSWVAKVVAKASSLGIIATENTSFRPSDSISRAEAMKMLLKAFAIDTPEVSVSSFSDVSGWAVKYVEKARTLWIVASNPTFRPADSISRAEVSKIVIKTMELK